MDPIRWNTGSCTCFSIDAWAAQLKTCEDEESFRATYQSFLNTTWQALQGVQQCTGDFPFVQPTTEKIRRAYYMKNRTLILHNQIVWGAEADDDRPVIPTQEEQLKHGSSKRGTSLSAQGKKGGFGDHGDGNDPNEPAMSSRTRGGAPDRLNFRAKVPTESKYLDAVALCALKMSMRSQPKISDTVSRKVISPDLCRL